MNGNLRPTILNINYDILIFQYLNLTKRESDQKMPHSQTNQRHCVEKTQNTDNKQQQ